MDIFIEFAEFLAKEINAHQQIFNADKNFMPNVEFPRVDKQGDFTTNAAMVLAKGAKKPPRELAEEIKRFLQSHDAVRDVTIAGAGFVNWHVHADYWVQHAMLALQQKQNYGFLPQTLGKVNVEYVSANPTGPLHVGHVRGAVFGDVLANILSACGYQVSKEYYVNDAGGQIDLLVRSVYWRYQELVSVDSITMPEGCYPGEYVIDIAQQIKDEDGDAWLDRDFVDYFDRFRALSLQIIMQNIRKDLALLGIEMDDYISEYQLVQANKTEEILALLADKNLLYQGILPPPKGKLPDDWEERPQTLFKSSEFGDDIDRPLKKSNGENTYFCNDIAAHFDKYQRGFQRMINVFGADHAGYVKRLQAAVKAFSDGQATLHVSLMQIVRLLDGGAIVKMSKREGNFVTLQDLVKKVGADAIRFTMLTRDNNAQMDFDFALVTAQSSDNPVFYVQYAHARICSLKKLAQQTFPDMALENLTSAEKAPLLAMLTHEKELMIIKKSLLFPIILQQAGKKNEPHLLCYYLLELAETFHKLWSAGNKDKSVRFIVENDVNLTKARLILVDFLLMVLANGLKIMNVSAPEKL